MKTVTREFQVFIKPAGPSCNLDCHYCYYLKKKHLYPDSPLFRMPEDILEATIVQHIEASTDPVIRFSWHGGEPTVLGLDYFRQIVGIQRKHLPPNRKIFNGIQTNGTLLDEAWCRFFADEGFAIGISLDGPQELHNRYRVTKDGQPTFEKTLRGYQLLQQCGISAEILCVVNGHNVRYPLDVYRFFKQLHARYITFLPLVEFQQGTKAGVSRRTVPSQMFGNFLCTIFDEWKAKDIGKIQVQIFEEAARTAFGQEHTLCVFRETCGGVPVIEHNGDFYSCDHFVDEDHRLGNIMVTPLADLLDSPAQKTFGHSKLDTLPHYCRICEVRAMCQGGCPKNRFIQTPDGEKGLNYLCEGYKQFFAHCQPFVSEVAALWQKKGAVPEGPRRNTHTIKIGRNDPCPCGSGKKYKNCCMKN